MYYKNLKQTSVTTLLVTIFLILVQVLGTLLFKKTQHTHTQFELSFKYLEKKISKLL